MEWGSQPNRKGGRSRVEDRGLVQATGWLLNAATAFGGGTQPDTGPGPAAPGGWPAGWRPLAAQRAASARTRARAGTQDREAIAAHGGRAIRAAAGTRCRNASRCHASRSHPAAPAKGGPPAVLSRLVAQQRGRALRGGAARVVVRAEHRLPAELCLLSRVQLRVAGGWRRGCSAADIADHQVGV